MQHTHQHVIIVITSFWKPRAFAKLHHRCRVASWSKPVSLIHVRTPVTHWPPYAAEAAAASKAAPAELERCSCMPEAGIACRGWGARNRSVRGQPGANVSATVQFQPRFHLLQPGCAFTAQQVRQHTLRLGACSRPLTKLLLLRLRCRSALPSAVAARLAPGGTMNIACCCWWLW